MASIRIIGGGVAGLALAAALDPEQHDVTVVERREQMPDANTSLAIWPGARAALEQLGVLDGLADQSPSIERFPMRSATGRLWAAMPVPPTPLVGRHDLLRALDAAVPGTVRREHARVETHEVGAASDAEVVVGADGVHSAVRRAVWGKRADASLTPYVAVRGVLPVPVAAEAVGEYWGRGRLYGMGPHRAGTNWYASVRSELGPRDVDVAAALERVRRGAEQLAPALRDVLRSAAPDTTLAQRIWAMPRLSTYVSGRFVLVGDAAHAMTPNLGRGGCEALVDAVRLAHHLNVAPAREALVAYDRERVRPTRRLAAASATLMRLALAERGQPARDGVLAVVSRLQRVEERDPTRIVTAR